jgi:hypothetical protein
MGMIAKTSERKKEQKIITNKINKKSKNRKRDHDQLHAQSCGKNSSPTTSKYFCIKQNLLSKLGGFLR